MGAAQKLRSRINLPARRGKQRDPLGEVPSSPNTSRRPSGPDAIGNTIPPLHRNAAPVAGT